MSPSPTTDPFANILSTTNTHRAQHGCGAYPYDKGTLLGVLAAAVKATRIIEVGTALGYSALWLAHGALGYSALWLAHGARMLESILLRMIPSMFVSPVNTALTIR